MVAGGLYRSIALTEQVQDQICRECAHSAIGSRRILLSEWFRKTFITNGYFIRCGWGRCQTDSQQKEQKGLVLMVMDIRWKDYTKGFPFRKKLGTSTHRIL